MSVVHRSRALVVVLLGALALVVAMAPTYSADAAAKKHFKQLYTCGTSDDDDQLGSASDLEARVNLGHWQGIYHTGKPCLGGKKFVPSVTGVNFTFRWYVGTTLVRTSPGKFEVHPGGRYDDLHKDVVNAPGHCGWFVNGKRVSVKVAVSKAGYATRVVTISCFPGGQDQ
jgi:hypothetical protein